jgi:hypothetical protein
MIGDVTVIGLAPVTCPLEDIAMDVPHGTSVVIPAEKAAKSRDLWRAVSQRLLFRLDNGVMLTKTAPNPLSSEVAELRDRVRVLEEENRMLRATLEHKDAASQVKLDAILAMLQSGPVARVEAGGPARSEVVDVAPPPFIPSKIRSEEPFNAHVQAEQGSSEAEGVTAATSALRRIRQGGGQ